MLALALSLLPTVALADDGAETGGLAVAETYYFDLSAWKDQLKGTINENLPDETLRYVPFIYCGSVNAYVLKSGSAGWAGSSVLAARNENDTAGSTYTHRLFLAAYDITKNVTWTALHDAGLVFGAEEANYESAGAAYMLRLPSVGQNGKDPPWNEWSKIADNSEACMPNRTAAWGQDTAQNFGDDRSFHEGDPRRSIQTSKDNGSIGYRPVLEILNDLEEKDFQVVTLNLNGGSLGGETQIRLAVKAGEAYDAPSFDGLEKPENVGEDAVCYWRDQDGKRYAPGDVVASDVTELTAVWGYTGVTVTAADGREVEVTAQNSGDVLSDGGSVKYDASRATLELNGAKLTRMEAKGILILQLQGTNTVTAETGDAITAKAMVVQGDGRLNVEAKDGRAIHLTEAPTAYLQQGGNVTLQGTLEADIDDWQLLFSGKTLTIHAEIEVDVLSAVERVALAGAMLEGTKLTLKTDKGQSASVTLTQDYDEMMRRLDELMDETKTWGDAGKDFTVNYLRLSAPGADSFDPGWAAILPLAGDNNPFRDVRATDWYYQDVMYAYGKGLMNGTAVDKFSPQETFTRGMLLTILARHDGVRTNGTPWYQAGCDWALANGISDGKNPEEAISREEFAQILYRYAAYRGSHTLAGNDISGFTDAGAVSPESLPAVQWAVAQTILRGDNYRLNPQGKTTRAEAAAMLHRFF